ncbi:terminase gpA endonuclease subunit [Ralstonia sp.]|uniref:terminase gpA endonuclease subunit n=1 Tax=Ralstonia sp. TaxID=54061 RepID=UPI0025E15B69|nr:terminase gpA endonuclease subunit [Ralstonia sp.]
MHDPFALTGPACISFSGGRSSAYMLWKRNPIWPVKKPSRKTKAAFRPVIIGVNTAKDTIRNRLHAEAPGPGFMHFPADRDIGYFEQLTSERSVVKVANGQKYRVWELPAGRANEALDCRVYAYAALCGLTHIGLQLNKRADQVAPAADALAPAPVVRSEAPVAASAPQPETSTPQARGRSKKLISRLA